jgi:hypothetical protein
VPTYLADKGLKTFADIARFEKELGGKIYGIEPGSGANTQIKAMIAKNQFGLGKFQLVESSEAGMLAAVDRAVRRKEAVVFFGWAPHPMNVNIAMTYLTGSDNALGPNEGMATVWTVTAPTYAEQCPNIPPADQPDLHRRRREPNDAAAARSQGRLRIRQAVAQGSPARQAALARRRDHLRRQTGCRKPATDQQINHPNHRSQPRPGCEQTITPEGTAP